MAAQKYLGAESISALKGKVNTAIEAAMANAGGISWSEIGFQTMILQGGYAEFSFGDYQYKQIGDVITFSNLNSNGTYLIGIQEGAYGIYYPYGSSSSYNYGEQVGEGYWKIVGGKQITPTYPLYAADLESGEKQERPFMMIPVENPSSTLQVAKMVSSPSKSRADSVIFDNGSTGSIFIYRVA